jgi:hypothetical protein
MPKSPIPASVDTARAHAATAILVLGMHRSGTSAVTRLLNLCGADLGRELLPPKEDNERGFWENADVLHLHERLLTRLGLNWHDAVDLPAGWVDDEPAREFGAGLPGMLARQFAGAPLIAVKDPRLALTAPLWIRALAELDIRPAFVIVVRHPDEVAASLARRDALPPELSRLLWLQNLVDSERATRGHARVFVHYERLLSDWRAELTRITDGLRIEWPAAGAGFDVEVARFLAPALRHHRHDAESRPPLPELVQRAYLHACTAAADLPFAPESEAALERDFAAVIQLAAPLQRTLAERLARESRQHEAEVARARAAITAKDGQIDAARRVIAAKDEEIAAARRNVDALASELGTARTNIDTLAADLERAREAIAAKDAEIDAARGVVAAKDDEITAARGVMAAKDDEIAAARVVIAAKDVEIARAREAAAVHEQEILAARHRLDALGAELDALRGELDVARGTLDARSAEIDAARGNIDTLVAEIDRARQAHAERDAIENAMRAHVADLERRVAALRNSRWFRLGRTLRILDRGSA